jgi:hypothetical protein
MALLPPQVGLRRTLRNTQSFGVHNSEVQNSTGCALIRGSRQKSKCLLIVHLHIVALVNAQTVHVDWRQRAPARQSEYIEVGRELAGGRVPVVERQLGA